MFFGTSRCLTCEREVVLCAACRRTTAVDAVTIGGVAALRCTHADCGAVLLSCRNAKQYSVCNGSVVKVPAGQPGANFCRYCSFNKVIPSLVVDGNLSKWSLLEDAKRRVLTGFERAGFNLDRAAADGAPPLRFEFKEAGAEIVTTGHSNGIITIRLAEADSVFREQRRVQFGESKRTLTDHFRHELGHYVWLWIVKQHAIAEFRDVFGDETRPTYGQAKQAYYQNGSRPDWPAEFVTEYASMHPWEDFAESFRVYLEMQTSLETAVHFDIFPEAGDTFDEQMTNFLRLGIVENELARDFGFDDLVAENFPDPVIDKLRFLSTLPGYVAGGAPAPAMQMQTQG